MQHTITSSLRIIRSGCQWAIPLQKALLLSTFILWRFTCVLRLTCWLLCVVSLVGSGYLCALSIGSRPGSYAAQGSRNVQGST